jgi:thiol-disulfide isomerase/thioredoxin
MVQKREFRILGAFQSPLGGITMLGLIFVFATLIFRSLPQDVPSASDHPALGRSLLDLHLQGPEPSETIGIDSLRGSIILINFWGIWCPPCRAELPYMASLANAFDGLASVRVLAVSCGPPGQTEQRDPLWNATRDYLTGRQMKIPIYTDLGGVTRRSVGLILSGELSLQAYPTTILLDQEAKIRAVWIGFAPGNEIQMRREIERLLARSAAREP